VPSRLESNEALPYIRPAVSSIHHCFINTFRALSLLVYFELLHRIPSWGSGSRGRLFDRVRYEDPTSCCGSCMKSRIPQMWLSLSSNGHWASLGIALVIIMFCNTTVSSRTASARHSSMYGSNAVRTVLQLTSNAHISCCAVTGPVRSALPVQVHAHARPQDKAVSKPQLQPVGAV
jgi:hypothetical protein